MYIIWLKVEGIEEFRVWLCLCDEHRVGVLTAMFKSYAPLIQDILLCSTLLFFFSPSTATVPFYCFHFKSLNWPHILGQYLGTLLWSLRFQAETMRSCQETWKLESVWNLNLPCFSHYTKFYTRADHVGILQIPCYVLGDRKKWPLRRAQYFHSSHYSSCLERNLMK